MRQGRQNLWIVASAAGEELLALRAGFSATDFTQLEHSFEEDGTAVYEFTSSLGTIRSKVTFPCRDKATVRCTMSLRASQDIVISSWPRDLYSMRARDGTVHTAQRGLRAGVVFASASLPNPFSLFYFQDFSSLNEYFARTQHSPADSVSGRWPELGYAPPSGEGCTLPRGREIIVSDAYLTVSEQVPATDGNAAAQYLDMLADIYLYLPRPQTTYHDWPTRAAQTLRDLSFSPDCTYVRGAQRYLMPYVGDKTKPPESMVQLTLAVNTDEYDRWRGETSSFGEALRRTIHSFFDDEVSSLVRWLPGADFGPSQAEENMNHDAMDSWYLHHSLFNIARLATKGEQGATDLFRRSLPFVMRVARRFAYRWPIFFNLRNLDVIRAESAPGEGGENDVGGLYALVMLQALELFGCSEYLDEAVRGVQSLEGLGFRLGYQMNTTGFAAEAALRLWKKTGDSQYLELSEICMANLMDNMWLWQCRYGRARDYNSFFGLFPLRDAPYLAAYEELEAHAKFHEYLSLGGEDVRPSLRVLLCEYQKYSLNRGWHYYPDTLPADSIASKSRNGRLERALSIPMEDLQDGFEPSGQVGQELYGAGLPFIFTSRQYERVPGTGCFVYCNYPMYDYASGVEDGTTFVRWRVGGDPRCQCELRVIPVDVNAPPASISVTDIGDRLNVRVEGVLTAEGHAAFILGGTQSVEIKWCAPGVTDGPQLTIGAVPRDDR